MTSIRSKLVSGRRGHALSDEARRMRTENHPWLKFNNASPNDKIDYLNRLALMQNKQIFQSRYMDFALLRELGVEADFERMMETKIDIEKDDGTFEYDFPVWRDIFTHSEPSCREWMLEFFSTVRITRWPTDDDSLITDNVISFHCGGILRRVTIPEFGYYAGLYPLNFYEDEDFTELLKEGIRDSQGFGDGNEKEYFVQISSDSIWTSKSKVNHIRNPLLRILQKLICYNFQHRSTMTDKAYQSDMWLMRLFDQGAPGTYACFPYVLAKHMITHKDSMLFGGHFITSIVKKFNCHNHPDNRHCSPMIPAKEFTWADFARWKVLGPMRADERHQLIQWRTRDNDSDDANDDEVDVAQDQVMQDIPQQQPFEQPFDQPHGHAASSSSSFNFDSFSSMLDRIQATQEEFYRRYQQDQRRNEEDHQWMGSQLGYLEYNMDRYRPYLETHAQPAAPYQPPDIFIPMHRQGGFYYPPQAAHQPPRHDYPPVFGTYAGTSGAGGSGTSNVAQDFADQIFGRPHPPPGDGTDSAFGPFR